jgi:hypothetical protein
MNSGASAAFSRWPSRRRVVSGGPISILFDSIKKFYGFVIVYQLGVKQILSAAKRDAYGNLRAEAKPHSDAEIFEPLAD